MLCHFGQKVEGREDLEVAFRATPQIGTGRAGEAAAPLLFGSVDHGTVIGQADDAGQAEGTPQDILRLSLQGSRVVGREVDTIIDTEPGVRPSTHLVNCRLVDLAGG